MAGGRETPRQRMIGILYLVLLGLIALNVPDSLLNAFKNISDSLSASKSNVQTSIDNTFDAFEKTKLKDEPERAKEPYAKAKQAQGLVNDLDKYVESLKTELINKSGGYSEAIGDYSGRENLDVSSDLMINNKKGDELRAKIEETRNKLMGLLDAKDRATTNLALQANDPPKRTGFPRLSWQEAYFGDGIPMGAAMTALTKVQSDAKNSESEVIKKLLGKVDQAVVNLDKFSAVAVAPSSYVIAGQPYTAEVFLTASDSRSNPDITVNGSRLQVTDGRGKYQVGTGQEGVFTWVGTISVKQADGQIKTYKTAPQTYQVAKPSAVVSPDKMNVLYIGVPNPISVSAPGIPKEKLKVSITEGSVSGSAGHYIANVKTIGTVKVNVTGEASPGKTTVLGSSEFRVKRIPDPKAQFAGKSSGSVASANLKAQDKVFARLENFEFDAHFNVTRFTMWVFKPRQDAIQYTTQGSELSSDMHRALATVSPGTKVFFTNIIAVGPDGTQRGLDDIVLSAN